MTSNRKRDNSNNALILTNYLKESLIGLTLGDLSLKNKKLLIIATSD